MTDTKRTVTGLTFWEKVSVCLAAILTIVITGYSYINLIVTGTLSWHISQPATRAMMTELFVIWLLLFLLFYYQHEPKRRMAGGAVLLAGFCWLHQMFLPVFLAGIYTGYLILTGRNAGRLLKLEKLGPAREFCLGSTVVIVIFCMLSLLQLGSIRHLRLWVFTTGMLETGYEAFRHSRTIRNRQNKAVADGQTLPGMNRTAVWAAVTAATVALLFMQAGRMNLAVDFDSIWYGVRSAVMLDSGNSIYENLGTLGVVYTYPKGWEVLTLPLSGLPSYSFPIAFNLWVAVMVLLAAGETAAVWMKKEHAPGVPFLMAAVPGIMNMSITAKADMLTLFYQILMIQAVLKFIKDRKAGHLVFGLAAAGISLAMKPTALIFSSAVMGMSILWLLCDRLKPNAGQHRRTCIRAEKHCFGTVLIAAAALLGIWGRTMKLVGIPVTSVFHQIFQKLGFRIKYPFYAAPFPAAGSSMPVLGQLELYGKRLYGILLNPQGDDMAHVIIAWGTVFPLIFLVLLIFFPRKRKPRGSSRALTYLALVLAGVLLVNLVSLYSLYQIDGNYYMLFYALLIISGGIWLDSKKTALKRAGAAILLIPWGLAVLVAGVTNWAWSLGFSPIQTVNTGYYNHIRQYQEEHARIGCQAIWEELAADPKNRVIALGEPPRVLTFPCHVQSYVDVSGYWGNPEVVSDAAHFLEYLHYAGTDYIYMEQQYVDTSVRIHQIIRSLIAKGWLFDVRDENGNLIMRVAHSQPEHRAVEHNLEIFDLRYIQHP